MRFPVCATKQTGVKSKRRSVRTSWLPPWRVRTDLLVVFSDGVTEAESPEGEEYGDERLATWLGPQLTRPAAELLTGILEEVDRFTEGAPAFDDVTLVVARYPEKT